MPDTGAPWNIPYVEAADLVSDWPADSLALANAIDAGLDAANNAGIGSNVVQDILTSAFSTTSTSMVDSGISVTITPSSATSKILVISDVALSGTAGSVGYRIVRDSTDVYIGSSGIGVTKYVSIGSFNTRAFAPAPGVYLDSPATTSPVTYKIQVAVIDATGTLYINRSGATAFATTASGITAIEVAA